MSGVTPDTWDEKGAGDKVVKNMRSKKDKYANAEDLSHKIPVKNAEWVEKDGHLAIIAPRFRGYLGRKFCEHVGRNPNLLIRFNNKDGSPDEVAKLTWMLIDGNLPVGEIQKVLEKRFPEENLELMQLAVFLRILERNN